jgi:hypothetical protein
VRSSLPSGWFGEAEVFPDFPPSRLRANIVGSNYKAVEMLPQDATKRENERFILLDLRPLSKSSMHFKPTQNVANTSKNAPTTIESPHVVIMLHISDPVGTY